MFCQGENDASGEDLKASRASRYVRGRIHGSRRPTNRSTRTRLAMERKAGGGGGGGVGVLTASDVTLTLRRLSDWSRGTGVRERGSEGGKEEEGIMGHVPSAEAELLKLGLFLGWSGGAGEAASSPRWIKKKACREVEAEPPPTAGKMP